MAYFDHSENRSAWEKELDLLRAERMRRHSKGADSQEMPHAEEPVAKAAPVAQAASHAQTPMRELITLEQLETEAGLRPTTAAHIPAAGITAEKQMAPSK